MTVRTTKTRFFVATGMRNAASRMNLALFDYGRHRDGHGDRRSHQTKCEPWRFPSRSTPIQLWFELRKVASGKRPPISIACRLGESACGSGRVEQQAHRHGELMAIQYSGNRLGPLFTGYRRLRAPAATSIPDQGHRVAPGAQCPKPRWRRSSAVAPTGKGRRVSRFYARRDPVARHDRAVVPIAQSGAGHFRRSRRLVAGGDHYFRIQQQVP
jgi:hypothetical protein